jgi:hypothetical protein
VGGEFLGQKIGKPILANIWQGKVGHKPNIPVEPGSAPPPRPRRRRTTPSACPSERYAATAASHNSIPIFQEAAAVQPPEIWGCGRLTSQIPILFWLNSATYHATTDDEEAMHARTRGIAKKFGMLHCYWLPQIFFAGITGSHMITPHLP